jgi:adenylate kinase
MNIVILGPQGSGKGTQAKLLSKKLELKRIEAGALVRKEAEKDKEIWETINVKGKLIPAEKIFGLIKREVGVGGKIIKNVLFDGYPRSLKQYKYFKNWFDETGSKLNFVILLMISEDETIKRLSARRSCPDCGTVYNLLTNPPQGESCNCGGTLVHREDDMPEAIKKRLIEYKEKTEPIVEEFRKEGLLLEIDGERPIDVIFDDIQKKLKEKGIN